MHSKENPNVKLDHLNTQYQNENITKISTYVRNLDL
jgi:hypothetical protein